MAYVGFKFGCSIKPCVIVVWLYWALSLALTCGHILQGLGGPYGPCH